MSKKRGKKMAIKIERIEKDTGKKFITYSTPNKVSKKILSGWIDININRIKEDLISELNDINVIVSSIKEHDLDNIDAFVDKNAKRLKTLIKCDL
jgi:hypothetical protein